MDRAAALTYLAAEFGSSTSPYLSIAGISVIDDTGPVQLILNSAYLRMGVAYADLGMAAVADADVLAFLAVLRYETLRWLWNNINDLVHSGKIGAGQGVSTDLTDWRKEFMAKIAAARAEAFALGVVLPLLELSGWQAMDPTAGPMGVNLNYLQGAGSHG